MSVARVGRPLSVLCRVAPRTPRPAANPLSVRWFSEEDNPRRLGTRFIDLRSDTVTKPTPAMALASMDAQVGDDVFGEDPTVRQLEAMAAEQFGKEAGLFVPSGTMGNLISVATHCQRGEEVILGSESHIYHYEQGGVSALMGIPFCVLPNEKDGTIAVDRLKAAIKPDNVHYPVSRVVALENTQNRCGGKVLKLDYVAKVASLCRDHGLALHMDGARIMNAAVALKVDAATVAQGLDSISVCLSKGLGAPVGSVIVGTDKFIHKARRLRKVLGGGMRQAGVIAAPGIVALTEQVAKLAQDHSNAKSLARGLSSIPGVSIEGGVASVETNIMFIRLCESFGPTFATTLTDRLRDEYKIRMNSYGSSRLRAVTHHQVKPSEIDIVIEAFEKICNEAPRVAPPTPPAPAATH